MAIGLCMVASTISTASGAELPSQPPVADLGSGGPTPRPDLPGMYLAEQPSDTAPRPAQQAPATAPRPLTGPGGSAPGAVPPRSSPPPGSITQPRPILPPPRPAPRPDANALAQATPNYTTNNQQPEYRLASTVNMIGDTLGLGYFFVVKSAVGGDERIVGNVPIGDASVKIGDDCSPLPVDRVFFDYNHFHNALRSANGADVSLNRYTFGMEKTFFDGMSSLELKAPIDGGLNATQVIGAPTSVNEGTLFGTLALTPKVLLHESDDWAMSGGLAIGLPTSPTAELRGFGPVRRVTDDAVHLAPFLGLLLTPNDRWFSITYLQFDFDTNGNRVFADDQLLGRIQDPTLMYVDCSVGYWLFNYGPAPSGAGQYWTGLAPIVELHYTTTLQNADQLEGIIRPVSQRVDILNLTAGFFIKLGRSAGLTVAGVAPLRTQLGDKEFDAEVLVQFNRWF